MPKVLDLYGFRVEMYFNDHPPPHCHVAGKGGRAKFNLNCPAGPTTLVWTRGIRPTDLRSIKVDLDHQVPYLCQKWGNLP